MAKIQDITKALEDVIKAATSKKSMEEYGNLGAEMIRVRTRDGFGVKNLGAGRNRLKPLSKAYINRRKNLPLHSSTTPSKSNLTASGQMLDSLKATQSKSGDVTIGATGKRFDGKSNSAIAQYAAIQGRPFNNLSSEELRRIAAKVDENLKREIKKLLPK